MSNSTTIIHYVSGKEPHGWISQEAIERIRSATKIGDIIRVKSNKGYVCIDVDAREEATDRRGKVLSKHKHLCVLEYPGGLTEAFRWDEIAKLKRKRA